MSTAIRRSYARVPAYGQSTWLEPGSTAREHGRVAALLEREELLAALAAEATRGGRLVFVGGEAGVGKTALVRAFVAQSAPRVLAGIVREPRDADAARPVRGRRGEDGGALWRSCSPREPTPVGSPAPSSTSSPGPRLSSSRTSTGPTRRRWTRCGCSAGAIDDTRALVVATYRDDEVDTDHPLRAVLGELASAPGVARLSVPRLSLERRPHARGAAGADGDAVYALTGRERLLRHRGPGGRARRLCRRPSATPCWPATAQLGAAARRLLDVAALVPGKAELCAARGGGTGRARPARQLPCRRRPPRQTGDAVAFRHELARLALEDSVPAGRRRRLHAALLQASPGRGAGCARTPRASPTTQSDAGDTAAVLEYAPEAARRAAAAALAPGGGAAVRARAALRRRARRPRAGGPPRPLRARGAADRAVSRGGAMRGRRRSSSIARSATGWPRAAASRG